MPVLKELSQRYGFKIIIPSNDHEPKHVHVFKGDDDYAKIEIETLNVIRSYLKPKELKQALKGTSINCLIAKNDPDIKGYSQ